jgi:aminopeptidase N
LFYDLDLTILPETKSIRGSNCIRWKTVHPFRRMQVDLYANLAIGKIVYHGRELAYTREGNAVYIDLPATVPEGRVDELSIFYSGRPLQPEIDALKGGIFWLWNRDREIWIESVTQGIGASVFWPCKDHLSDRPDSMRISITVPKGLTDISNGRLLRKMELPDGQTRFEWYVDYPIVTYDVVINIGDYAHFSDSYSSGGDTLALNYYCMPYNVDSARTLFADVKRMLTLYEKDFGPYPFRRDGFTVLEAIYPMDHQGAVSIGSMRNPFNSNKYDGDIHRTMWHESSHEWWGNSVGCSDYADMWIHESFADYAEFLNGESITGRQAELKRLFHDHPENKEPIIGVYNVNHFHMGDMYLKGSLLLETLRDVIGDDSLWFTIFRGIQERFRYQPVRTEDIVSYFNTATGKDYTYFFDQYLRHPAIPVLALTVRQDGEGLRVAYKWEADVPDFRMPIKVTLARDSFAFIYPTTTLQTMEIKRLTEKDFAVDTAEFYVGVRRMQ